MTFFRYTPPVGWWDKKVLRTNYGMLWYWLDLKQREWYFLVNQAGGILTALARNNRGLNQWCDKKTELEQNSIKFTAASKWSEKEGRSSYPQLPGFYAGRNVLLMSLSLRTQVDKQLIAGAMTKKKTHC